MTSYFKILGEGGVRNFQTTLYLLLIINMLLNNLKLLCWCCKRWLHNSHQVLISQSGMKILWFSCDSIIISLTTTNHRKIAKVALNCKKFSLTLVFKEFLKLYFWFDSCFRSLLHYKSRQHGVKVFTDHKQEQGKYV